MKHACTYEVKNTVPRFTTFALCFVLSFPQGCDKKFFSSTELVIHIRNHTGERPFVCSYCGDAFISKSTLSTHEKSIHGIQGKMHGEKGRKRGTSPAVRQTLPLNVPLIFVIKASSPVCSIQKTKCEICDKVVLKRSLHCHMRKHENPARKLSCTVCGKEFATKGGVTRHEAIHFEDKKYACQYCGKAFVQKANMEVGKIETGKRDSYFYFRVYPFLLVSREDPHRREALLVQVLPGEVRPEHQEVPASSILQVRESVCLVERFVLYSTLSMFSLPLQTPPSPRYGARGREGAPPEAASETASYDAASNNTTEAGQEGEGGRGGRSGGGRGCSYAISSASTGPTASRFSGSRRSSSSRSGRRRPDRLPWGGRGRRPPPPPAAPAACGHVPPPTAAAAAPLLAAAREMSLAAARIDNRRGGHCRTAQYYLRSKGA